MGFNDLELANGFQRGKTVSAPPGWRPAVATMTDPEFQAYLQNQSTSLIIQYKCPCGVTHCRYSEDWENAHLIDPLDYPIACRECGREVAKQPRYDTSERQLVTVARDVFTRRGDNGIQ